MVKTNDFRRKYYYELLPEVLNQLQDLEKTRIGVMRDSLMACVNKEKEVAPIINGCHDVIVQALVSVNPMRHNASIQCVNPMRHNASQCVTMRHNASQCVTMRQQTFDLLLSPYVFNKHLFIRPLDHDK
jgi:hypothetical protein